MALTRQYRGLAFEAARRLGACDEWWWVVVDLEPRYSSYDISSRRQNK